MDLKELYSQMDIKELSSQAEFLEALFCNFIPHLNNHISNIKNDPKWRSGNYMNKNCGKYALKRKITLIRQELLNLEKMIESE